MLVKFKPEKKLEALKLNISVKFKPEKKLEALKLNISVKLKLLKISETFKFKTSFSLLFKTITSCPTPRTLPTLDLAGID